MKYKNAIAVLAGCIVSAAASASLVYDSTIDVSGQGFGTAPRALTIQATGTESGCVGVNSSGAIVVGPAGCTGDATHAGNGVIPVGGDEPNPLSDNQKYGIPTLGSLGITNASQIGILFNSTEPGGDSINVLDITLNFFSSTAGVYSLLASIDGSNNFPPPTDTGNGVAGYVFVVDSPQQTFLNNNVFNLAGSQNIILSLNSTITDAAGGPESFLIFKRDGSTTIQAIPEPGTLALIGIALLGGLAVTRRRLSLSC